jgi:hypothetical protein
MRLGVNEVRDKIPQRPREANRAKCRKYWGAAIKNDDFLK